jgi:hypothetical protein
MNRDRKGAASDSESMSNKAMNKSSICLAARLAALVCFSSPLSFAGSWSGALVNSKCWTAEERNVNPADTTTFVDRDRNLEIRFCSPNAKTKSFAIVLPDGLSFQLDAVGNAKAAELIRQSGKGSVFTVAVTGEMIEHTVKVDSISMAR